MKRGQHQQRRHRADHHLAAAHGDHQRSDKQSQVRAAVERHRHRCEPQHAGCGEHPTGPPRHRQRRQRAAEERKEHRKHVWPLWPKKSASW